MSTETTTPVDFTDYQFHASQMGALVDSFIKDFYSDALTPSQKEEYERLDAKGSDSKKFKELQKKIDDKKNKKHLEIKQATKTKLYEIWLKESLNIQSFISNQYTEAGNKYEQASIDLLNRVFNKNLQKNEQVFNNDYLIGTPDIIADQIVDIKTKSRFDLFDAADQKEANNHFWQLWTYKQITGKSRTFIAFVLPSFDDQDIFVEQDKKTKNITDEAKTREVREQVYLNMNFDRIPETSRNKIFEVSTLQLKDGKELSMNDIEEGIVYEYLEQCRAYLNGITNNKMQYFK